MHATYLTHFQPPLAPLTQVHILTKMHVQQIEKDIQCALHSDPNCEGGTTRGYLFWPEIQSLRPNEMGLTGDIVAFKCRKCEGCNGSNYPDWDGKSTEELQPASIGDIGIIHHDKEGHWTLLKHL
jgi:hypothetical protein